MDPKVEASVKMRVTGADEWWTLAVCKTAEAAGAVIHALCRPDIDGPLEIRIDVFRHCKPDAK